MAALSYKQTGYAVLECLKRHTDENHCLKQMEIVALLQKETGLVQARKSIRKDLGELQAAGYPVRYKRGWYYEHEFCPAQLNLMIDSLRNTSGVTAHQRDDLVRKISRLGGDWYAQDSANSQLKPANPQFLYTLDILHEAIANSRQVLFYYGDYDSDKQLHRRKRNDGSDRDYLINPYYVVCTNGRYYLIGNIDKYDDLSHYRIDRIMDIQPLETPAKPLNSVTDSENTIDLQKYVTDHPYMYHGKPMEQRIRINRKGINDVLDWFGMESMFENEDGEWVDAVVTADESSTEYWKKRYEEYLYLNQSSERHQ